LPWYRWPIEIDGLPIKNGDFPWLCNKKPDVTTSFHESFLVPGAGSTSKEFSPRSATWKRRRVKILRPPIIDTDFHVGYRLKMRYIMIYHDIPQN